MSDAHRGHRFCVGLFTSQMLSKGYMSLLILLIVVLKGATIENKGTHFPPTTAEPQTNSTDGEEHSSGSDQGVPPIKLPSSATLSILCYAQCMAKCEDFKLGQSPLPEQFGIESGKRQPQIWFRCFEYCYTAYVLTDWIRECRVTPICVHSCNYLNNRTETSLPPPSQVPPESLHIDSTPSPYEVELKWEPAQTSSNHTVFYVVEESVACEGDPTDCPEEFTWSFVDKTTETSMTIHIEDVCATKHFHVAAVNQFGTRGFTTEAATREVPRPSQIQVLDEYVYYENHYFYYVVTHSVPTEWYASDINGFDFNLTAYSKVCKSSSMPPAPLPPTVRTVNETLGIQETTVRIFAFGYTCLYYSEMYAESRCSKNAIGVGRQLIADLQNCHEIRGFPHDRVECVYPGCDLPGKVRDVTTNHSTQNVNVTWTPPEDMGSMKDVEKFYILEWMRLDEFVPASGLINKPIDRCPQSDLNGFTREGKKFVPFDENLPAESQLDALIQVEFRDRKYALKVILWGNSTACNNASLREKLDDTTPECFVVSSPTEPEVPETTDSTTTSKDETTDPGFTTSVDQITTTNFDDQNNSDDGGFGQQMLYIFIPVGIAMVAAIGWISQHLYKKCRTPKQDVWTTESDFKQSNIFVHHTLEKYMIDNPFYHKQSKQSLDPIFVDHWEIQRENLVFGDVLGRGAFGQVIQATLKSVAPEQQKRISTSSTASSTSEPGESTVAVKMLLEFAEDTYKLDFIKEIALMKSIGVHPNVVSIIGCVTVGEPLCLVVEHVPHGDLLHYLRDHRSRITDCSIDVDDDEYTLQTLLCFARQISVGMEFLGQRGFVHRDLATRNVLVGERNNIKIGDFGLTRYIYDDQVYVTRRGGKLPLKWMAIEAIFDLTFTASSDVWSFGVVLFELVTLGGTPYPTIANKDLLRELKSGYRMEKPDNCSDELYQMMLDCWSERPGDRPTFTQLRNWIEAMIEANSSIDYITFEVDEEKDYYRLQGRGDVSNRCSNDDDDDDDVFASDSISSADSSSLGSCFVGGGLDSASTVSVSSGRLSCPVREGWHPNKVNRVEMRSGSPGQVSVISGESDTVPPLRVRQPAHENLRISTCSTDQLIPPGSPVQHTQPRPEDTGSSIHSGTWF